jgi:hypothetical protein
MSDTSSDSLEDCPEGTNQDTNGMDQGTSSNGHSSNHLHLTTCVNCNTSYAAGERTWLNRKAWALEKKLALMAGKAAFDLEAFIFKHVLPAKLIRPFIFPRTIDEMASYIENCSTDAEREDMRSSRAKWDELRTEINWTVVHEQVLTSAKQSYLMIKPPSDMVKEINATKRSTNDLIRAFRTALPVHLRPAGDEIVEIMLKLNLV